MNKKTVYRLTAITAFSLAGILTGCNEKKESESSHIETDATVIMGRLGCFGCHTQDGTGFRGPSFKGIFGRPTILKSGDTLKIDEAYLRKSILEPSADLVRGYPAGLMPKTKPTPQQLDLMVEYLKEFKYSTEMESLNSEK